MKQLPLIFSTLALLGVIFLGVQSMNSNKPTKSSSVKSENTKEIKRVRIACINLDTLEKKYLYFNTKKEQFEAKQKVMEGQIEAMGKALQNDYLTVQKKAQEGTLTQAEYDKAEKRLAQKQRELENERSKKGNQLLDEQEKSNKELRVNLEKVVAEYNKDNKFDYVISYTKDGMLLYNEASLDITMDIVEILNKQ